MLKVTISLMVLAGVVALLVDSDRRKVRFEKEPLREVASLTK